MPLFLAFLIVPLIEIVLFIQVGGIIGVWWTLLIVLLTAIAGAVLVRSQGTMVLRQLQSSLSEIRDPTEPLAHGAMILFSGALLLTPGFFTDTIGFALLVPGVRSWIVRQVRSRMTVATATVQSGSNPPPSDSVIEGEFEEIDPKPTQNGPSGWTRH